MCLGADVLRGKDQKPFDGKLDYDFIMWIDSDQVFSVNHLFLYLNMILMLFQVFILRKNGQEYTAN